MNTASLSLHESNSSKPAIKVYEVAMRIPGLGASEASNRDPEFVVAGGPTEAVSKISSVQYAFGAYPLSAKRVKSASRSMLECAERHEAFYGDANLAESLRGLIEDVSQPDEK